MTHLAALVATLDAEIRTDPGVPTEDDDVSETFDPTGSSGAGGDPGAAAGDTGVVGTWSDESEFSRLGGRRLATAS